MRKTAAAITATTRKMTGQSRGPAEWKKSSTILRICVEVPVVELNARLVALQSRQRHAALGACNAEFAQLHGHMSDTRVLPGFHGRVATCKQSNGGCIAG